MALGGNDTIEFDLIVNGKPATTSLKDVEKAQDKLGKNSDTLATKMKSNWLAIGAGVASAAVLFKQFKDIGDQWTTFDNKIKLSVDTLEDFTMAQEELFRIAQDTSSSMGGTVDLYQKLSQATRDLGTSQEDIFSVIETVNQSLIISGASAAEANSSIRQLGQGLASGVLRGDEFNSIMENSPRISKALSDSLGVTIGELRNMAQEGKLTSEIVTNALKGQADVISSEYDGMTKTVDQSFVLIQNSLGKLVSGFNNSLNGTDGVAGILQEFAEFLDENSDTIIDYGEDIVAVATIVKNGLYSIYLTAKVGYLQLTKAFKSEISSGLNSVVDIFESTLNYMIDEINRTSAYWSKVFGTDFGQLGRINIGEITIDDATLQQSLDDANAKIQELGRSTDDAFKELVTDDVTKKVVEFKESIDAVIPPVKKVEEAVKSVGAKTKEATANTKDLKQELTEVEKVYQGVEDTAKGAMVGAFVSWQEGALDFKETMRNVLNDIAAMIFEKLVVSQIFSGIGGLIGGTGGGFSSVLGAFADGGTASNSGKYLVGERGAEVVTLPAGANVTSNSDLGGTNVNVNVQNYGNDNVQVEQNGNDINVIISQIASSILRGTGDVGSAIESRYGIKKQ